MNDQPRTRAKNRGFVKLQRTELTEELLQDSNAFLLLTLVAYRARFTHETNVDNLKFGEALVGDYESCGLTRGEYRKALDRLEHKWRLVETRPTPRGTIARLVDSRVYSLTDERNGPKKGQQKSQPISEGKSEKRANESANEVPTRCQRGATNQNGKNVENEQNGFIQNVGTTETTAAKAAPVSALILDEVAAFASEEGIPHERATAWWSLSAQSGFTINNKPIHDWRAAFKSWAIVDAVKSRPAPDGMGNTAFWALVDELGYERDLGNRYVAYNRARGWKRRNPKTGRDEPIFDHRASLVAFAESLSDTEKFDYNVG